jgi:hypothetical protein
MAGPGSKGGHAASAVKALPPSWWPKYARRMSTPDETGARRNPDAGEGDAAPLTDAEQTRKDVSYSPGSEDETAMKQREPLPEAIDDDIDASRIRAVPGTGGPDDAGDVELDPGEVGRPAEDGTNVTSASEGDPMDENTPVDNLE